MFLWGLFYSEIPIMVLLPGATPRNEGPGSEEREGEKSHPKWRKFKFVYL
jgi:hypothetical protein